MKNKWVKIIVIVLVIISIFVGMYLAYKKVRSNFIKKLVSSPFVSTRTFDDHSTFKLKAWLKGIDDMNKGKGDFKTFTFNGDTFSIKDGKEA